MITITMGIKRRYERELTKLMGGITWTKITEEDNLYIQMIDDILMIMLEVSPTEKKLIAAIHRSENVWYKTLSKRDWTEQMQVRKVAMEHLRKAGLDITEDYENFTIWNEDRTEKITGKRTLTVPWYNRKKKQVSVN